jgi:hypothetical protein
MLQFVNRQAYTDTMLKISAIIGTDSGFMPSFNTGNSGKEYLGHIDGNRFEIRKKQYGRNSFMAIFRGTLEPMGGDETRISGEFGYIRGYKAFRAFFFGFMFVYILTLAIFSIVKALTRQFENQLFVFLGGSFALFGFLVVFFRVGKKTHLKEEAELEVFLRRLFK